MWKKIMLFVSISLLVGIFSGCVRHVTIQVDSPTTIDSGKLVKSAESLLKETETESAISYILYNYPSYFYDALLSKVESFEQLLHCEDYATVTLSAYKRASYYENNRQDESDEQWQTYSKKAQQVDNAMALYEILLANDDTFDQLSEEDKADTLQEVTKKIKDKSSGKYVTTQVSPFLFYVQEQNSAGKSKWYHYIMSSGDAYSNLAEILDQEILSWGRSQF